MPSVPTPSKAGIVENQTGDCHIPSSTRADGTKREAIRIRPGYIPPENVEVYKNLTAAAWKDRGSRNPPGAEGLKDSKDHTSSAGSAASNKNAKRRKARKRAAEKSRDGSSEVTESQSDNLRDGKKEIEVEKKEAIDPVAEREKKARNLKKKLKQAKELKEKSQQGGAKLLPEQFAKVIKINELIRELDQLGFDAEGEPKSKDGEKDATTAEVTESPEDTKE